MRIQGSGHGHRSVSLVLERLTCLPSNNLCHVHFNITFRFGIVYGHWLALRYTASSIEKQKSTTNIALVWPGPHPFYTETCHQLFERDSISFSISRSSTCPSSPPGNPPASRTPSAGNHPRRTSLVPARMPDSRNHLLPRLHRSFSRWS